MKTKTLMHLLEDYDRVQSTIGKVSPDSNAYAVITETEKKLSLELDRLLDLEADQGELAND